MGNLHFTFAEWAYSQTSLKILLFILRLETLSVLVREASFDSELWLKQTLLTSQSDMNECLVFSLKQDVCITLLQVPMDTEKEE